MRPFSMQNNPVVALESWPLTMNPEPLASSAPDEFFAGTGEMAALMRATDWSHTDIGAVETWPQSLKTVVRIMLTSRCAMWMGWGEQLNFFYNDACRHALGVKHPSALGQPVRQVWAEIWSEIGPHLATVMETGEAVWDEALLLSLERSGYPVETYHSFSCSPLANDAGETAGLLCIVTEVTERNRAEEALRERTRLAELGVEIGTVITLKDALPTILQRCAEVLVRRLDGALARIWTFNEATNVLELQASAGLYTHLNGPHSRVPIGQFKIGLIAEERKPHLTNAVIGDPRVGEQEWAKREDMVAFAGYPLLVEDRLVGVMGVFAKHALSENTLDAMAAVSHQIALGVERKWAESHVHSLNARLQRAMTETHHRVKNNLQLMSALIEMQCGDDRDLVPAAEFVRLGANIRALGVIHDILTQEAKEGGDQETLPAKAVLEELLGLLLRMGGSHILRYDIAEVRLSGRQATSLALITNELVANAQKHGKNETVVTLTASAGSVTLQVEDQGPGFPDGFDADVSANTGLELVENMVEWDLRGQIVYTRGSGGGGRVIVSFAAA